MHISELEGSRGRAFIDRESDAPFHIDYRRQVVLVTGAAGSIGSELCRQIVQQAPGAWWPWTKTKAACTTWGRP